ncbi:MAG TPA: HU family DNA-binding protein, partial [Acidimicrobiales bacterium]|nr:HU family DNA-binding protein [Acidimicrobiales bacterium]
MNRSELVDKVASTAGLEKRHAEAAVTAFVDSVVNESKAGNKVSIFGFGTFTPKHQEGRPGRNPRTGATVKIAPRNVVKFTAATAFKEALNARGAKKSPTKKAAPAKSTAAKSTPAKSTPAKSTPAKSTPAKSTPAKSTPAKSTPAKSTPA